MEVRGVRKLWGFYVLGFLFGGVSHEELFDSLKYVFE